MPAPLDAEIVDDDEALSEPWPDQQYDDDPDGTPGGNEWPADDDRAVGIGPLADDENPFGPSGPPDDVRRFALYLR